MFSVSSRLVGLAAGALVAFAAVPSTAQVYGYQPGGAQDYYGYQQGAVCRDACGNRRYARRDYSYHGQRDVPGDYRCDAYWDRGRTDCDARWRDQRAPWRRSSSSSYGRGGYGYDGPSAYYGEYGRPDVVYSGGSYGGYDQGNSYPDPYGHDHGQYARGGRDPQRINWCCAEYRSYDPATGYYTAYSGQRVFCG
jgi:hypothetical protein